MKKPKNYDSVQAKHFVVFNELPPGGYVCAIKDAQEKKSKAGRDMLVLSLEVTEGEHAGYFSEIYAKDKRPNKQWPGGAVFYQLTDENSTPFFKGLIEAIEKSNAGYKFNFNEKTLVGKSIGAIFGREQYQKEDGNLAFSTKAFNLCETDVIRGGVYPPKDRLLYKGSSSRTFSDGRPVPLDDGDVPW